MQLRKIGNTNLELAPLVLGGNVFGWTTDAAQSFKILDKFVDEGLNAIDTADVYSRWAPGNKGGESETIMGQWLKRSGKRDRVLIFTKVGYDMGGDNKGLRKDYILRAAEASLRRLQTDYIDLYQSHVDDQSTPLDETLRAYEQLISAGKVRAIGASNYSGERLQQALDVSTQHHLPRYECLQPHYNLVYRTDYEHDLEPVVLRNNIGVIPYYSLASGFLSGKYRVQADLGNKPRGAGAGKYLNEHGLRVLNALDEVARETGSTPARVALAWLIARPSITAPIASATSLDQLRDLVEATRLHLRLECIEKLNKASE
jgi:aryl-alcohol dehydrogenase-like predicted oxidoreductase